MNRVRRVLFWTAPPVLMLLVLQAVDLGALTRIVKTVAPVWVAAGLACSVFTVLVGAARWRRGLLDFAGVAASWRYAARHYWISLALGFVSPGQIGGDVYRTVVAGRSHGGAARVAAGIVAEKVLALLSAVLLVLLMFPMVASALMTDQALGRQILTVSALLAAALLLVLIGVTTALSRPGARMWLASHLQRVMNALHRAVPGGRAAMALDRAALVSQLAAWGRPAPLLRLLALSLLIQFLAAASSQFAFQALGQDVPFLVNLFVSPILFFALLLPISFAGIGVREGAFVLLYGAFGVSAEIALVASFITLLGVLLNNAIGATLIWRRRDAAPTPAA